MSPLCRVRKAVQIPGKVASEFPHRHALSIRLYLQGEVTPHESKALRNARCRRFLAPLEIPPYLAENPGISLRGAPHRNAVATGLPQHARGTLAAHNISVSDNRNRDRLFDLPYDVPVRASRVVLFSRPAVYGEHRGTGRL